MSHLPFLKALATERIPMNRIKTNPQCILVLSPEKKIKLRVYRYKKKKPNKTKTESSENKLLQKIFFPPGKVFFSLLWPTNKAEVSLNEVRSDLSVGSGRWHPVIQLRFPLACAVCSPLSSADLAISSPKQAKAQGGRRISHSNPVFCVLGPSEGARAGCNPWLWSAQKTKQHKRERWADYESVSPPCALDIPQKCLKAP